MAAFNEDKVKEIIAKELEVDVKQLAPEAKFIEDLGADSLDIVELVMALEEEFGIDIPDEEADKLKTVGDAAVLRTHILSMMEKAEVCDDPAKRRWYLSFIVVGAQIGVAVGELRPINAASLVAGVPAGPTAGSTIENEPVMPRWTTSSRPSSRARSRYLPRRSTARNAAPTASTAVANFGEGWAPASTTRAPGSREASCRRMVSTSGSSGKGLG